LKEDLSTLLASNTFMETTFMETLIENIVTKLQSLPQTRLNEVLNFVEFVNWQEQHTAPSTINELDTTISNQDFETLTNQLIDDFSRHIDPNLPSLSDYAVSRAGIYEEHP
jgi:hypothetical protein